MTTVSYRLTDRDCVVWNIWCIYNPLTLDNLRNHKISADEFLSLAEYFLDVKYHPDGGKIIVNVLRNIVTLRIELMKEKYCEQIKS